MANVHLPPDYPRIKLVSSFEELVGTPFADGVNALCWMRDLPGDFAEVARSLKVQRGITTLDEQMLRQLPLSEAGRMALDVMLADQQLLRDHELDPVLDCVNAYQREEDAGPVPTDVLSYHADSATVEADTYLCTYHGACSEALRNEDAIRRVDVPETRAELLREYSGEDDEGFAEYLSDQCYDLHYVPVAGAKPFAFGIGNLWRIALAYPGCPVPPCVHRAPTTLPGDPVRLLLLS